VGVCAAILPANQRPAHLPVCLLFKYHHRYARVHASQTNVIDRTFTYGIKGEPKK